AVRGVSFLEAQYTKSSVRMTPIVQPCYRLLARVAALREADGPLVETGFGGEDRLGAIEPEPRRAGDDPSALQALVGGRVRVRWVLVDELVCGTSVVSIRDRARGSLGTKDEHRLVRLDLDLDLRRKPAAHELAAQDASEVGLGQEQEVVARASPHHR